MSTTMQVKKGAVVKILRNFLRKILTVCTLYHHYASRFRTIASSAPTDVSNMAS